MVWKRSNPEPSLKNQRRYARLRGCYQAYEDLWKPEVVVDCDDRLHAEES